MRYLNWDVLLFPQDSKIPLQEFKTDCYVTRDGGSAQTPSTDDLNYSANPVAQHLLPTVTCFVPSLAQDHPLRVSLHSWSCPETSRSTQAMKRPKDTVIYKATVLLDGISASTIIFDQNAHWPVIIEFSQPDQFGDHDHLRFPPFHWEILTQNYWNAGENFGRIKIMIAEGLSLNEEASSIFRQTRNVVSFSFQHAPLTVLEDAGMAYPNAVMWCSTQSLPHVHSPHQESHHLATTVTPSRISDDPFVENGRHQTHKRGRRASSSDQSIPDYSYSVTPRSSRNISLQDVPKAACMWTLESQSQSQLEELMAALSPNKASGTYAPANTTATSRVNTPATAVKPSAAAKARAVSYYGQPHVGSAKLRDMNPLAKLNLPDQRLENLEHGHGNIKQTPTEEVKSRKEGKIHDAGSTKPGQRKVAEIVIGDSKRKRTSPTPTSKVSDETAMDNETEMALQSPTRKFSKVIRTEG